jgi:hypothetical protein
MVSTTRNTPAARLTLEERQYIGLLADYCLLAGIRDPASLLEGAEFSVDGVDFRLAHVPQLSPGVVWVRCDFGEIPEGQEADCYLELLTANAVRFDGMSPMMAVCPETGMAVCSARLLLKHLTAAALDDLFRALAKEARRWQHAIWATGPTAGT